MKRGDDVTIYMPMIPELPAAMVRPEKVMTLSWKGVSHSDFKRKHLKSDPAAAACSCRARALARRTLWYMRASIQGPGYLHPLAWARSWRARASARCTRWCLLASRRSR